MKLSNLHIDRFGARSDLDLADFTDNLNVVYGPNGSGKTTIIQFIRWMMFGDRDELSRRYLTTSKGPAAGSMTVRDAKGLVTLQRTCQSGSMLSQLTVNGPHGTQSQIQLGSSNSEFDRFFVVSFDRSRSIADLINSANLHGLQLHVDQQRQAQAKQLRDRIDQLRLELSSYGYLETQEQLVRLREERRREAENLRQQFLQRKQDLHQQRGQISSEHGEPQARVERLQSVLQNIEQALNSRQIQMKEEHKRWSESKRQIDERRERRLAEIESQVNRWQDILSEVRSRLEDIRARITNFSDPNATAAGSPDVQLFLQQLGFQMRDMEQDLSGVYASESWRDHEADADYLRGLLSSALRSMQQDMTRLGHSTERQQQVNELHETREELNYLCRVEKELSDLVEALNRQRHNLARQVPLTTVSSWHDVTEIHSPDTVQMYPSSTIHDNRYERLNVDDRWESSISSEDFRLRRLTDRRQSAAARLRQAELELNSVTQRLRELDAEISRLGNDPRLESIEKEIADIEARLRKREQRFSLERTISDLEDQLRRFDADGGTSATIERASELLRQLTDGEYSRIHVSDAYQCRVVGHGSQSGSLDRRDLTDSFRYDYSQLSRGVQDQVYLAITLAIVETLRAKGSTAPLILNDVFANLDQSGTQALARVLQDISSHHQVFVFTRHDHIRDTFRGSNTRIFTLREDQPRSFKTYAPAPTPKVAPPVRPVYDSAVELTPPPSPSYKWVAEWQDRGTNRVARPSRETLLSLEDPEYPSLSDSDSFEIEQKVAVPDRPALSLNSVLHNVSLLSDEFVGYMQRLNIRSVGDFLELDPEYAERELGEHGISADIVQRRQREILMIVYVGTTTTEAQLLVACGVPDPARLARADEAVLFKRVETILSRPQAVDRFGSIDRYGIASVRKWIESARNSRFSGRPSRTFRSQPAARTSHRKSKPATQKTTRTSETVRLAQQTDLRFYLELQDPVVDAPSIGPKTAEKLHVVDVITVADLLAADPQLLANRLNDKRISSDVIQQWQLQAKLVCCIPNLRGHDAQILVGCGVEDPITLSSLDPTTFLAQVTQFVESKEGQRAIRNAKKPDLAEVTAWIEWADRARQLRAA